MTDSPKQSIDEIVSAFVDGQASEFELQRLLKHMASAEESESARVRSALLRCSLSSEAISGSGSGYAFGQNLSFANGVSTAIADENTHEFKAIHDGLISEKMRSSPPQSKSDKNTFTFPFVKVAIAASVAFAFVFGAQQFYAVNDPGAPAIAASTELGQPPVQAIVPEGYSVPQFQANTAAATRSSLYQGKIELDEEQLQARLDEFMREVGIRQLQQLQLRVEQEAVEQ